MEMKKQKKIIGGMILVLAVTACASFFKSAAEEIAQEETSEIYQNEIKTIYTEAYQDEVETQIEEEKSSGMLRCFLFAKPRPLTSIRSRVYHRNNKGRCR